MRIGQLSAIDFGSKVVASLLGFVATLYFARVLGPDVLGAYFIILAIVGWLSLVGSMGVGNGLVKRMSEGENPGAYLSAGALILLAILIVLCAGVVAFHSLLSAYVGVPATGFVLILLIAGMTGSFVDAALQGQHLVHVYSLLKPVRSAVRSAIQVAAVVAGFGLTGLVVGYALGGVVAVVLGVFFLSLEINRPTREHVNRIVDYAKYAWLGQLKSQTFNRADILILGAFVASNLVGVYAIAWNIAGFLGIFSSSISSALFPEVSNVSAAEGAQEASNVASSALAYAGFITIPGLAGGALLGRNLLGLYGSEFMRGAFILVLLIAATVVYDYQSIIVSVLGAVDRPDLAFRVNGLLIISNVVLNVVLIYYYGWTGAAVATLTSAVVSLCVGYYLLWNLIDIDTPIQQVGGQVFSAAVMAAVVYAAEYVLVALGFETMRAVPTLAMVALGAGTYCVTLLAVSPRFRSTVSDNLTPLLDRLSAVP